MKVALIFIGLFCTYVAAEETDECPLKKVLEQTVEGCIKSLGASEETLKQVIERKGGDKVEVNCFRACMMKSAGLMENGKINVDKMEELMRSAKEPNEEKIKLFTGMLKDCKSEAEVTEDDCEVAKNYNDCLLAKEEAMKPKK